MSTTWIPYKHNVNILSPDPQGDASIELQNDLKSICDYLDGVALTSGISGSVINSGTIADARLSSSVQTAISEAHSPLSLSAANGLALAGQSLSLALATTSSAGAMSAADKSLIAGLGSLASLSTVDNAHLSSGIDAAKINTGSVSNSEFGFLDGVTSSIQTQLAAKLPTTTFSSYVNSIIAEGYIGRSGGEIDRGDLTISEGTLYSDNITLTNSGYFDLGGQGAQNCSFIASGDGAEIDFDSSGATYLCNLNMGGNVIDLGGGNIQNVGEIDATSAKINSQTVFDDGLGGENPLLMLEAPDYTSNSPFIYLRQPYSSNADLGIMFNVEEADTGDLLIRGYNPQAFPEQPYRAAGVRVSRDYGVVTLGDSTGEFNGTTIVVDDSNQTITLNAVNGIYIDYGSNIDISNGQLSNVGEIDMNGTIFANGGVDLNGDNFSNVGEINFQNGTQVYEQYNSSGSGTVDLIVSFNSSFPDSTLVCPSVTPNVVAFNPLSSAPSSPTEGTIYVDNAHHLKIYLNGAWKTVTVS